MTAMLRPFSAATLERVVVSATKVPPKKEELLGKWGKHLSGRMLECDWTRSEGWSSLKLGHAKLELSPAASCLHYALQCFEGLKAYRGDDGKIRLFRPELNAQRLNRSLKRLEMPEIPEIEFIEAMRKFVAAEEAWVPSGEGYAAYLRPTAIATDAALGVGAANHVKFFTILSPVGPYFVDGYKPVPIYAESAIIRAWPGGVGQFKIGSNYGPSIMPQTVAKAKHGAQQVLYCTPDPETGRKRLTEVGSMNIFIVWKRGDKIELATPPLEHADILPGVTRRSILDLAANYDDNLTVSEHTDIYLDDVLQASNDGDLLEVFGAGTAAIVAPINAIVLHQSDVPPNQHSSPTTYDDLLQIPVPTGDSGLGPLAERLLKDLTAIHYGRTASDWCVEV